MGVVYSRGGRLLLRSRAISVAENSVRKDRANTAMPGASLRMANSSTGTLACMAVISSISATGTIWDTSFQSIFCRPASIRTPT